MNTKTTGLNNILPSEVAAGDMIPFVDVSATTSPTGETKHITAGNLGLYLASVISPSYSPYQTSNGLWFDESVVGNTNNLTCYSPFRSLGTGDFSLSVRGMFASSHSVSDSSHRVIFGVGPSPVTSAQQGNSAYIGIVNSDLVGYMNDGTIAKTATIPNFFNGYWDKTTHITFVNSGGYPYFFINGSAVASSVTNPSASLGAISSSYVVMGQSRGTNNVACTIFEAQIWSRALTPSGSLELFFSGPKADSTLLASYIPTNLNPEPSQWLDSRGRYHLLLPVSGALATNPRKEFNLRFFVSSSGYLGNGTARDVLPRNYVLTSAVVSSSAKPLLSLGSSPTAPSTGSSGTGSFFNNRVASVSASYGINTLELLTLGNAHADKTLFVTMSGDNVCSFDFQGYIRD
jgi:hypothetical protein